MSPRVQDMTELSTPYVTNGIDHVAQGVTIAALLGNAAIHFGVGHSCSWEKQEARRERFKERMVDLMVNPPTDDEGGED